jgi:hypothetical protein
MRFLYFTLYYIYVYIYVCRYLFLSRNLYESENVAVYCSSVISRYHCTFKEQRYTECEGILLHIICRTSVKSGLQNEPGDSVTFMI